MPQLSPFLALMLECAGMAAGTFLCGIVPLYLSLSKTKLRILEVLGAGLLVGASMTVVLPEGVNALYDTGKTSEHAGHVHRSLSNDVIRWTWGKVGRRAVREHVYDPQSTVGMTLLAGFLVMFLIDQIASPGAHTHVPDVTATAHRDRTQGSSQWNIRSHRTDAMRLTRASSLMIPKTSDKNGTGNEHASSTPSMTDSPDFMPADRGFAAHVQDPRQSSVGDAQRDMAEGSHLLPPGRESTAPRQHKGIRQAFASIAGLIIHAAADGIAMGASAGSSDESLKLVVLFAIMIHKAPASFGLCTLLMGQRLHKSDIRRAVAIFSVATPTGAFLTYAFLSLLATKGNTSSEDTISPHHIGAALMFSAGTFLFVAMHAVQELASAAADADMEEEHHHRHHHNHHEEHHHPAHNSASPKQILGRTGRIAVFALGTILPKTMQIFVGHSH